MVRLQHKIQAGLQVLQYFTTRNWHFRTTKFCALQEELSPVDRETFFTDFEVVDDDEYITNTVLGARQYCLKEPPSSLPRCRRNLKMYVALTHRNGDRRNKEYIHSFGCNSSWG
jgi:fatty acyl-CoA reductase